MSVISRHFGNEVLKRPGMCIPLLPAIKTSVLSRTAKCTSLKMVWFEYHIERGFHPPFIDPLTLSGKKDSLCTKAVHKRSYFFATRYFN